jgi:hypothetical protein
VNHRDMRTRRTATAGRVLRASPGPFFAALCLCVFLPSAFAGQSLTTDTAPYDLCKLNWQSSNYLQALINPRLNAVAFAQDCFGDKDLRGGLYFIDDQGRVIRSLVEEAEYAPVARVEAVAAMTRGLLAARIPGSEGRYFFTIEGRVGVALQPDPKLPGFAAHWLQDSASPFCTVQAEAKHDGRWQPVALDAATKATTGPQGETVYAGTSGGCQVMATSWPSVDDRAPALDIASPEPTDIRITVKDLGARHYLWLGREKLDARAAGAVSRNVKAGFALLHEDAKRSAAASAKTGWEDPRLWGYLDSMVMVAWDPQDAVVRERPENGVWGEFTLEFRRTRHARVYVSPFLELDPADCQYVFDASERVARTGQFGFRPYMPVRPSNAFCGALPGLASAAYLLEAYKHPLAGQAKRAAIEAFEAMLKTEGRGLHGVYEYNEISAAYYLSQVAPGRFDYLHWVRCWADRDLQRCPPGWKTPPWDDTALRAMRGWGLAARMTGDAKYREAWQQGMAQFALPTETPLDAFLWRGERKPFNGYDCTASAMLIGEWGHARDPRAEENVTRAGKGYVCDFGWAPYITWTCDDLLPYYVGYSLPAVYGEKANVAGKRKVALDEFVGYDVAGRVWTVPAPPFPRPHTPANAG